MPIVIGLSAAVSNLTERKDFTAGYEALLRHYGMEGRKSQAGKAHENGDIEQRHHRLKRAVEQALLLRNSRDFASREEYEAFLYELFGHINAGRKKRLAEEMKTFVKESIAPYKYPRWIEFREILPKTATGKIQRFKLR